MKRNRKVIRLTESDLVRIVKRVLRENVGGEGQYMDIIDELMSFQKPKVIKFKDPTTGENVISLNWGENAGPGHSWGLTIKSDSPNIIFATNRTKDPKMQEASARIFKLVTNVDPEYNDLTGSWSSSYDNNLLNKMAIPNIKKLIRALYDE